LNFVNNFAALAVEMAEELREELDAEEERLDAGARERIAELLGDLAQSATKIQEHGERADRIVRSMLSHARGPASPSDRRPEPTDVNALLHDAVHLAYHGGRARDASFHVRLEEAYDPAIGTVEAIPQDLSRVFVNVANNACYAAFQHAQEVTGVEPAVSITTRGREADVEVRIRDNGGGIPGELRERIFEPFFTSKPVGEGTGLGLSISYDIVVKQHGGDLCFETEPGKFTEFIITLPRQQPG
jgi:signal transduction histidine kinase